MVFADKRYQRHDKREKLPQVRAGNACQAFGPSLAMQRRTLTDGRRTLTVGRASGALWMQWIKAHLRDAHMNLSTSMLVRVARTFFAEMAQPYEEAIVGQSLFRCLSAGLNVCRRTAGHSGALCLMRFLRQRDAPLCVVSGQALWPFKAARIAIDRSEEQVNSMDTALAPVQGGHHLAVG